MKHAVIPVSIDHAVGHLQSLARPIDRNGRPTGKPKRKSAVCMLGAGCSVTAGIPLADTIAEHVWNTHFARAKPARKNGRWPKTHEYPDVMHALPPKPRYDEFKYWMNGCTLNKAHAALGYLVYRGLIGRLFTTNFDDLVLRGCALYGVTPAVHDLGLLSRLTGGSARSGYVAAYDTMEPSVLFLHGRYNGFWQIHDTAQATTQAERLQRVFRAHRRRQWIVIGYSGECDALRSCLAPIVAEKQGNLLWVNLRPPSAVVQQALDITPNNPVLFLQATADDFFGTLAHEVSKGSRKYAWTHYPVTQAEETVADVVRHGNRMNKVRSTRHTISTQPQPSIPRSDLAAQILQRVRTHLLAGRNTPAETLLRSSAVTAIANGESRLHEDPPSPRRVAQALRHFTSASEMLSTRGLARRDAKPASMTPREKMLFACDRDLHQLAVRYSWLYARAMLGAVRAAVATGASMQWLDQVRDELLAHRKLRHEPALLLAIGIVELSRATAAGIPIKTARRRARDAVNAIESAVSLLHSPDPIVRRRASAAITAARNAITDADPLRISSKLRHAASRAREAVEATFDPL